MSIAFQRAQRIVEKVNKQDYLPALPEKVISELKANDLSQGEFVVNTYWRGCGGEPKLLGMTIARERLTNEKIEEFAKKEKMRVEYGQTWAYFMTLEKDPSKRKELGRIENNRFLATTPELFEKIGKELYNLKTVEEV